MSVLDKTNVDMETALLNDKGASVPRTPDFSQPERSGSVFRCRGAGAAVTRLFSLSLVHQHY